MSKKPRHDKTLRWTKTGLSRAELETFRVLTGHTTAPNDADVRMDGEGAGETVVVDQRERRRSHGVAAVWLLALTLLGAFTMAARRATHAEVGAGEARFELSAAMRRTARAESGAMRSRVALLEAQRALALMAAERDSVLQLSEEGRRLAAWMVDDLLANEALSAAPASLRSAFARRARTVLDCDAQSSPGGAERIARLALGFERVGGLLANIDDAGARAEALAAWQSALSRHEQLAQRSPGDPTSTKAIAACNGQIGALLHASGDLPGGRAHLQAAAGGLTQLHDTRTGDDTVARDLMDAHAALARFEEDAGRDPFARQSYARAFGLGQALQARHPKDAEGWGRLARVVWRLGVVRERLDDPFGALTAFETYAQCAQCATAGTIEGTTDLRDLAFAHRDIGDRLWKAKHREDAIEHYRSAMDLRREVASRTPRDLDAEGYRHEIRNLGEALSNHGRYDDALALVAKDLHANELARDLRPTDTGALAELWSSQLRMAHTTRQLNDVKGSVRVLKQSFEVGTLLAARGAMPPKDRLRLAGTCRHIGLGHAALATRSEKTGQGARTFLVHLVEARSWFGRGVALFEVLGQDGTLPRDELWRIEDLRQDLARCEKALGSL